jgi:hypothetical protein
MFAICDLVISTCRHTPLSYGNRPGTCRKRKSKRTAGEHYTTANCRRAILRACDLAFPAPSRFAAALVRALRVGKSSLPRNSRPNSPSGIQTIVAVRTSSAEFRDLRTQRKHLGVLTSKPVKLRVKNPAFPDLPAFVPIRVHSWFNVTPAFPSRLRVFA